MASISPAHARIDIVLDKLEEMVPSEVSEHPMARMFLTVLRESKKDLRRVPEDFILALSRPIGLAFTWVAEGDPDLMTNNDLFAIPDDLYSDLDPSSADLSFSDTNDEDEEIDDED